MQIVRGFTDLRQLMREVTQILRDFTDLRQLMRDLPQIACLHARITGPARN